MYSTLVTETEHKSEFVFTTDTPYLALTGELWGVYFEKFGESWPPYKDTALYMCQWIRISIGSGNDLSPVRRQAITWTNTDSL